MQALYTRQYQFGDDWQTHVASISNRQSEVEIGRPFFLLEFRVAGCGTLLVSSAFDPVR